MYVSPISEVISSRGVDHHQYADDTQLFLAMRASTISSDPSYLQPNTYSFLLLNSRPPQHHNPQSNNDAHLNSTTNPQIKIKIWDAKSQNYLSFNAFIYFQLIMIFFKLFIK